MRIAVVGGGIAGLTAAYRLRTLLGDSVRITVLEAGPHAGGKVCTAELSGLPVDTGAEAFLARRPEALDLVDELGLRGRLVHPADARPRIRAGARTVPLPAPTVLGIPGSPDVVAEALSPHGRAAVRAENDLPVLALPAGDVSLGALLRERFGDELVDRVVDPLLGGVYAGGADGLGLRAVLPELARQLDAGAGSLTSAAAALLPAETARDPVFGTLHGGLSVLVRELAARSAAEIRYGEPASGLRAAPASGWRVGLGTTGAELEVDGVVLAVPAPVASDLLAEESGEAARAFAEVELASMAVVQFAFPPGTELPDASGVLIATGERHTGGGDFTAKAFTFLSRKWPHYAERAAEHGMLVRGSVGRFADRGSLQAGDAELIRSVRADLAEVAGVAAEPTASAVYRWNDALPQYGVGHTERVGRIDRAVAGLPRLAVAGAALRGVGIPACIGSGDAAARAVARGLTGEPPAMRDPAREQGPG
ncbi:protoporphyrinogen oxidase [Haloechinothrix sp. YIM 98757]|uniref:Coproporphyrinogen III oxidase n=1 Tax=Haloechinothrix aidingensis TaxID=2752311 RepID=A0A838A9W3_9PSEU|nr:protoporphyrinogen oxidase [Haloechinothrix aidingensis]MBA0126067.1 protoporphyrinogen oxidase [Haloechinothrix aidingensis]